MLLFAYIAGPITALLVAGFFYQRIGARRDRRRYTGEGRTIDIGNGCTLYVRERGSSGPAVIFESGIAASHLNWFDIQERASSFASTTSYDRAGLGWSSPSRSPRTPSNVAAELHSMLEGARIKPPYVLVGHSFGGLVMRRFALLYPEEVSGLVLVDPMRCEEWPPIATARQSTIDRGKRLARYAIFAARFGLARVVVTSLLCRRGPIGSRLAGCTGNGGRYLFDRVTGELGKMPREVWPIVASHWSRPGFYAGMRSHVASVPATVMEMEHAAPIHDIPILVLTPDSSSELSPADLARIGEHAHQVVVPASTHWIHLDQPELVLESIREMVTAVAHEPAVV